MMDDSSNYVYIDNSTYTSTCAYEGPYRVLKTLHYHSIIDLNGKPTTIPIDRLKPANSSIEQNKAYKGVKKIIKCFCNCTDLTEDQVKEILNANVNGVLRNPLGKKLFRNSIGLGHTNIQPKILERLRCYEMCEEIINNSEYDLDKFQEILSICPPCQAEFFLSELVDSEAPFELIKPRLQEIMNECKDSIERDSEFQKFQIKLLNKLK